MDLSPQAWTAVWGVVALVAVFVALCLAGPLFDRLTKPFLEREDARCAQDEQQWWLLHRIEQDARRLDGEAAKDGAA